MVVKAIPSAPAPAVSANAAAGSAFELDVEDEAHDGWGPIRLRRSSAPPATTAECTEAIGESDPPDTSEAGNHQARQ